MEKSVSFTSATRNSKYNASLKMAPEIIVIYSMTAYYIVMSLESALYFFPLSQPVLFFSMLQLQGGSEY